MENQSNITSIDDVIKRLANLTENEVVYHASSKGEPMPSIEALAEIVDLLRQILFPGYYGQSSINLDTIDYYIGVNIDKVLKKLQEQIKRGLCFACAENQFATCVNCGDRAKQITQEFIFKLPNIRDLLSTDVKAAYLGDPAANNYGEVIYCYPAIKTMTNFRIAHELYLLNVPLIPRIITEMAHSETGIDIHPAAQIGEYFSIDHGTGVVIGETCVIGRNVKIYQGVTLGAKSFPLDENGNPIKGIPRHPIVEDNVVIYAESTILGRITIGKDSVIGGNVWLTHDLPPNSKISQFKENSKN